MFVGFVVLVLGTLAHFRPARNASQREFPILRNSGVRIFPNPGLRKPDFGNRKPKLGREAGGH